MEKRQKVDRQEAYRLVNEEHKTQTEVAKIFGVNRASVSRALKELRPGIATVVALEAGHKIVSKTLDVVGQLHSSNERIDMMVQDLVKKLQGEETKTLNISGNREIRLVIAKLEEERRKQWGVQLEMIKTLTNFQSITEFQSAVLETLSDASTCSSCGADLICKKCEAKVDLKGWALVKLKQKRALRAGVQFRP